MPDGDVAPAQALGLLPLALVGVGVSVAAAHGLVGAVALDGLAGAAGAQLLHQAHGVEQTLLLTLVCRSQIGDTHSHLQKQTPVTHTRPPLLPISLMDSSGSAFNLSPICADTDKGI